MKKALLEILVCPYCELDLVLHPETTKNGEVVTGTLGCSGCDVTFDIRGGVPCMLGDAKTAGRTRRGFTEQWQIGQGGDLTGAGSYGQDLDSRARFLSEIDVVPQQSNAWVLDAGCGSCELLFAVAAQNPQARVVGLDFCDTIYAAAGQAARYPNVDLIHGDIMLPPFKKSSFNGLYALGVLHHTNDTEAAFKTTAPLVATDGAMATWIYPHRSESLQIVNILYLLRDVFFLGKGHLLPGLLRFRMAQAASLLCSPAFAAAFFLDALAIGNKIGRQRLREVQASFAIVDWKALDFYRFMTFLVFDSITPEHQFRHRRAEVVRWFKECGLGEVQAHDAIPGYYWAHRPAPAALTPPAWQPSPP